MLLAERIFASGNQGWFFLHPRLHIFHMNTHWTAISTPLIPLFRKSVSPAVRAAVRLDCQRASRHRSLAEWQRQETGGGGVCVFERVKEQGKGVSLWRRMGRVIDRNSDGDGRGTGTTLKQGSSLRERDLREVLGDAEKF